MTSNTDSMETALAKAYVRGVEWRDENSADDDYAYRFKAANDYAEKNSAAILTELQSLRASTASGEPVAWLMECEGCSPILTQSKKDSEFGRVQGWTITPLYASSIPYGVKPLEWSKTSETTQNAETILGWYHIDRRWNIVDPARWYWNWSGGKANPCETEAEAKAAAQADYEQRIRSALEPSSPLPATIADAEKAKAEAIEMLLNAGDIWTDHGSGFRIHFSFPPRADDHVIERVFTARALLAALSSDNPDTTQNGEA